MLMVGFFCSRLSLLLACMIILTLQLPTLKSHSHCLIPRNNGNTNTQFHQRVDRFWEFDEKTKSWVEIISFPFDLTSCANGNCTKVGLIESRVKKQKEVSDEVVEDDGKQHEPDLPIRKRISVSKMSEASVWVTGQSGSIYERFWNGAEWVIAPHELPTSAAPAISVFIVNQNIISLSEAGILYQLQLNENSQPIWTEFELNFDTNMHGAETKPSLTTRINSGHVSHDGERLYLSTTNSSLLEISEFRPLRWENHGRPQGGDVFSIADTGSVRPGVVFTVSSSGDLYEFDKKSKPSWKKHIRSKTSIVELSLAPSTGCVLHGLFGAHSLSFFLLTKDGYLVERRLHRRKWKWRVHEAPKGQYLSAITGTTIQKNDATERTMSLFLTTASGSVYEYQFFSHSGVSQENKIDGLWVKHAHPPHARVARGVHGVQIQTGRILFPLDDGRLGELHCYGVGAQSLGPTHQNSIRRKRLNRYEWSIIDTPETEGWNAEYCTGEHGPLNCIAGVKDVHIDDELNGVNIAHPARRSDPLEQKYISLPHYERTVAEASNFITKTLTINFRMRVMHPDRSFFFITDSGLTFEYMYTENVWLWLRHEQSTTMKGALASYNGSLFLVDIQGNLLIRERNGTELLWINCTAMKKGKQVESGPPWDDMPGKARRLVAAEDALYFVSRKGRLLQFTVAMRKFKWKDCQSPPDTKIAYIVDQQELRMNIIFIVGKNGRLYQYNRITELWHKHYQSPHLILSVSPGTAMRPSPLSLTGSLFMISENGGLIEYHWNSLVGWEWVEHGTPYRDVKLVGAPGPSFDGTHLFVIGSDGNVYQRHLDQRAWKWKSHGCPYNENGSFRDHRRFKDEQKCAAAAAAADDDDDVAEFEKNQFTNSFRENCNEKVAPTRPIQFSEGTLVYELQDGRLAELRRWARDAEWEWARIIDTPTSLCLTDYWAAVAS